MRHFSFLSCHEQSAIKQLWILLVLLLRVKTKTEKNGLIFTWAVMVRNLGHRGN